MNELEKTAHALRRLVMLDMAETYNGRCPRCRDHTLVFVPTGDLLMVSHPTTRLGACVPCWHQQVLLHEDSDSAT